MCRPDCLCYWYRSFRTIYTEMVKTIFIPFKLFFLKREKIIRYPIRGNCEYVVLLVHTCAPMYRTPEYSVPLYLYVEITSVHPKKSEVKSTIPSFCVNRHTIPGVYTIPKIANKRHTIPCFFYRHNHHQ
jgi:hypothetical protein